MRLTIARPRPVPGRCVASGLLERKNSSNRRTWSAVGDAQPLVGDREDHGVRAPLEAHRDLGVLGGVLHRVADQVDAQALDLVALTRGADRLVGGVHGDLDRLGLGLHADDLVDVVDHVAQVDRLGLERTVRVADGGQHQHVRDEALQAAGVAGDDLQRPALHRVQLDGLEQLEVADDRGERVLELVGDGLDQLRLVAVELAHLVEQLLLALEEAGVQDRPAEVVTDVEGRVGLDLGPLGVALGAGQREAAEALGAGAQRARTASSRGRSRRGSPASCCARPRSGGRGRTAAGGGS